MTAAARIDMEKARPAKPGELLLGEDWVSPEAVADPNLREAQLWSPGGLRRSGSEGSVGAYRD